MPSKTRNGVSEDAQRCRIGADISVQFYVEDILPMVWNDTAFDYLVYDEQQKDLIMSFVEHHGKKEEEAFDDVIIGKGESTCAPYLANRTDRNVQGRAWSCSSPVLQEPERP